MTNKAVEINIGITLHWKNRALVKTHIKRIFDISAKNSRPNLPDLYSILNPETSSLSPSAKSKGARLVSEIIVTSHINNEGRFNNPKGNLPEDLIKYPFPSSMIVSRKKIKEISYEIVWALARKDPKKAYLLLDLQPAKKIGKTLSPEITRNTITLYLTFIYLNSICIISQNTKARPNVKGAILKKKFLFLLIGTIISLV